MKKFLCYDTNDAASGKIEVDNRGMLKPNSTVPSGSTPYQQLVTDGEGNAKWEDRLAYAVTEEQVIFSQENIAFIEQNGKHGAGSLDMPETINVGEKYRVNFDGETYDCIAHMVPRDSFIYIGNGFLNGMPDDTGEPFLIMHPFDATEIVILTSLTNSTHTVFISRVVETVHKIPEKWLPEKTKVYITSNDDYMYFDSERTRRLSAEDFISAVNSVGIDFIELPISSEEVHLQMIGYKINETSGTVIASIAWVSSDGSTITILGRNSVSAGAPS